MPKQLYQKQLRHIIQNIELSNNNQILVRHNGNTYDYVPAKENGRSNLFEVLSNVIYNEFYATGGGPSIEPIVLPHQEQRHQPNTVSDEKKQFIQQLSQSNQTIEGFDKGWRIETKEMNGMYYATKGNFKRPMAPGEFISELAGVGIPREGQKINFFRRKELTNENSYFYYVFSRTVGDRISSNNVRIYFNITSGGAPHLVKNLTTYFNRFKVPFDFKCLNNPAFYSKRVDTAVLYLPRVYANYGLKVLFKFLPAISMYLKDPVPLFTFPLGAGFSFAESPPNIEDSFGTSRAKMIVQGILNAHEQQIPSDNLMQEVITFLKKNGFDLNRFHLNPDSNYSYHIPEFNKIMI